MKISRKKLDELYHSIHEQVTQARIKLYKQIGNENDFVIAQLPEKIYKDVCVSLNITLKE